jgi:hypothetical protein
LSKKNKNDKVLMIPENETRDKYTYSFIHAKTATQIRAAIKLKFKKYHPGLRKHIMFIETRLPAHK